MTAWKIGRCLTDKGRATGLAHGGEGAALPAVVATLADVVEAPGEVEASPALLRIGCVLGVQPDKWQRRWRENRPDVSTSWEFLDSAVQWEGLRRRRWSVVLVRTAVPAASLELLSYGATDAPFPADLVDCTHVVELYRERWVVLGRKKHDIGLVSSVTPADLASLPDKRISTGELTVPAGNPALALRYAESGAGLAILPETLAKAAGRYEGTVRPLEMAPGTRVCAVWLKDRSDDCPEELVQEFIGMIRGRRVQSSRSSAGVGAADSAAARKQARKNKQSKARAVTQEQRRQRIIARQAAKRAARKRGKRS